MKKILDNLIVSFETKEQAELIQLVAYKYGYNWEIPPENSLFLSDCLKYLPIISAINFEKDLSICFADLDYYQIYFDNNDIISFEEFIKSY